LLARITIRPIPEYCQALRNDLYSSHGRNTIQCPAFVCSGKLSPERQRHDEENTHSLVSSGPDLINHDTSSITDASAPRCAGGQSASRRTDLAAQRAELDAGLARDRRLNRDESREKLHSIQRCSPIKAAPLALWSARQRRRFGLFITKSPSRRRYALIHSRRRCRRTSKRSTHHERNENRDCPVHYRAWLGCARRLDNWCKSSRRTSTIRL